MTDTSAASTSSGRGGGGPPPKDQSTNIAILAIALFLLAWIVIPAVAWRILR
jgi:hypothetical protein